MEEYEDQNIVQYRDNYGQPHTVKQELSRGGQGVVLLTKDNNILLKVEIKNGDIVRDDSKNEKYFALRILPIDDNIHITLPKATLVGVSGYVMEMLEDMVSFSQSFEHVQSVGDNEVLKEMCQGLDDIYVELLSYISSGGKRRRTEAFMKAACILSQLHANGLVYCDFSLNNVFISKDFSHCNVWLIDADNLNTEAKTKKRVIYTPFIGAPEVVLYASYIEQGLSPDKGCGNTFSSDVYTFAVTLFKELFLTSPYEGQQFEEELNGCDDREDIDKKLNLGEYDYILDNEIDENLNAKELMIPIQSVVTKEVENLFQHTLGYSGKWDRTLRPTMFEWVVALARDLDKTVKCCNCGMDYIGTEKCPWCDFENNRVLLIKAYYFEGNVKGEQLWEYNHEIIEDIEVSLPARLIHGFDVKEIDDNLASIKLKKKELTIEVDDNYKWYYSTDKINFTAFTRSKINYKKFFIKCRDEILSLDILLEGELR